MATEQAFVEYIQAQSGLGRELSYKKMFGERSTCTARSLRSPATTSSS